MFLVVAHSVPRVTDPIAHRSARRRCFRRSEPHFGSLCVEMLARKLICTIPYNVSVREALYTLSAGPGEWMILIGLKAAKVWKDNGTLADLCFADDGVQIDTTRISTYDSSHAERLAEQVRTFNTRDPRRG